MIRNKELPQPIVAINIGSSCVRAIAADWDERHETLTILASESSSKHQGVEKGIPTNSSVVGFALNETWKGEAQDAFVAKFESMQSSFTSFSEMLEGYATLMDTAARELQNTDQGLKATMQSSFT